MKITCAGCGKTYNIDPEKMQHPQVKSRCKVCGETLIIAKPASAREEAISSFDMDDQDFSGVSAAAETTEPPPINPPSEEIDLREMPAEMPSSPKRKGLRFGLRWRLFIFFFLIPILLIAVEGYLYLQKFNDLSSNLGNQSTNAVKKLAEQIIAEKAHAVAGQVRLYLESHPNMRPEQFYKDDYFKTLAMQQVGKTGYTAMHVAEDKDTGAYMNWIHSNPAVVGTDLRNLSQKLPKFWAILSAGKNGRESSGYYDWEEKDKSIRSKFMVCTPVIGTPYYVAATTYVDEFTVEIDRMKTDAQTISKQTQTAIIYISLIILILIGAITFWYGRNLTSKVKSLTDLTERISVGDLDAEINIKSNDEIGDLGNAISRMQDSIRISIERLRRRK